jgi:hypothetical protein
MAERVKNIGPKGLGFTLLAIHQDYFDGEER